ncbi:bolA-like protein 2 [Lineus longissimus]|uniref:bolA-like protein 2 n=1 Tax=Lineus longissimus TaxID=88925 RepID=UPI002B4D5B55
MSVLKEAIEEKLRGKLEPIHLEIEDTSGGCGASFSVVIVSKEFAGKALLQRHRLVNEILAEEIKSIHAFQQKTLTPEQWQKQQDK